MIGSRRMPALAAGALVIGASWTATANEVADYCMTSMKSQPAAAAFTDLDKFCACLGEKTAPADHAVTVTVMRKSDEARIRDGGTGRIDTATLPPDQGRALETLRNQTIPACMQVAAPKPR